MMIGNAFPNDVGFVLKKLDDGSRSGSAIATIDDQIDLISQLSLDFIGIRQRKRVSRKY